VVHRVEEVVVQQPGKPSGVTPGVPEQLDARKARILRSIVAEFVANGEPVGSRRVVDVAGLDVSSATVRNEMSALEERGYIDQPHTSAGRVPTDKGYRAFVDLLEEDGLDDQRRRVVEELLGTAHDVEELLSRASLVLSQLTRLATLVVAPTLDTARCKLVEVVPLSPASALLLLVDDTGRVVRRPIDLEVVASDDELARVRAVLAEHVLGQRMSLVHDVVAGLVDRAPSDLRGILVAVETATREDLAAELVRRVFVGGQAALAGETTMERAALMHVLELLEERTTLAQLLDDSTAQDGQAVRIGAEHEVEGLRSTSLVAQRYQVVRSGSLGVLGPTRMDYGQVLSIVRAVSSTLEKALTDLRGDTGADPA
jgi:heat-inducible transcriptional repressor